MINGEQHKHTWRMSWIMSEAEYKRLYLQHPTPGYFTQGNNTYRSEKFHSGRVRVTRTTIPTPHTAWWAEHWQDEPVE